MALSLVSIAAVFLFVCFFFSPPFFKPVRVTSWPLWTPHGLVSGLEPQGDVRRCVPAVITSPDANQHLRPPQPLVVYRAAARVQVDAGD